MSWSARSSSARRALSHSRRHFIVFKGDYADDVTGWTPQDIARLPRTRRTSQRRRSAKRDSNVGVDVWRCQPHVRPRRPRRTQLPSLPPRRCQPHSPSPLLLSHHFSGGNGVQLSPLFPPTAAIPYCSSDIRPTRCNGVQLLLLSVSVPADRAPIPTTQPRSSDAISMDSA